MDIKQELAKLNLPVNSYFIVGSGILGALGIREPHDIDMVVSKDVFTMLDNGDWEYEHWPDQIVLKKDIFDIGTHWEGVGLESWLSKVTVIDDIPYVSLEDILAWKKANARPKDLEDVILIENYLSSLHE